MKDQKEDRIEELLSDLKTTTREFDTIVAEVGILRAKFEFRNLIQELKNLGYPEDQLTKVYPDGKRIINIDYEAFINDSKKIPNRIADLTFDLFDYAAQFQVWEKDYGYYLFVRYADHITNMEKVTHADLTVTQSTYSFFDETDSYAKILDNITTHIKKYFENL